ncbi:thiamine pyrophosphate-binding protein [Roseomonas terrae]|jgi:thiamine pyrophosphate-dependent acetolactate synthase large subunit-like protein|uniref:Thiamine pyrophosphate-binding protein n=1 Tax=Neoroseomonas terrae TaxID=424799 RepID=A0ABS5EBF3_9PROT|nr:thiamine pyrophosphate-dependent enzyme [Neoroseomonas terrae]MBR0648347.1 thiamine pyrophosphate-binding protein [Neoroseomonas terrae]
MARTNLNSEWPLRRRDAVPRLVGRHEDFLIVAALAGTVRDCWSMTTDGSHAYAMSGAMGAGAMVAYGLAMQQPKRRVLGLVGDADLLMNLGSLATIAATPADNLSILCVDNGMFAETGNQVSHTGLGADLEAIARGAGFRSTCTVREEAEMEEGAAMLRRPGLNFVLLKVGPEDAPDVQGALDASFCRQRFRTALLGHP